jgi:hypothetical protein
MWHIDTQSISIYIRGTHDGDFCAVDVKKMEVSHWSKKVHLGSPISSIEFCPVERYQSPLLSGLVLYLDFL